MDVIYGWSPLPHLNFRRRLVALDLLVVDELEVLLALRAVLVVQEVGQVLPEQGKCDSMTQ